MRIPLPKPRKRSREYPIKRDEYGRSARQRAFEAFDHGKRPGEVVRMVGVSPRIVYRYFADWKKLPRNLESKYRMMKTVRKSNRGFSRETIESLATYLEVSAEEVKERLEKPWGLKQLLMGQWPNYRQDREQSEAEFRLCAALHIINLVESHGVPPEKILDQLLKMKA